MSDVVNDLDAVNSAVIDLVLDGFEKVVVADGVIAGFGRGSGEEQDPCLAANEVRVFGIVLEPVLAFAVPIADLRAEGEGGAGVEGDVGLVGFVRVGVGSDLGEDTVGLLDEVLVDGVGVGGAEIDADGAAENEDGDEAAEDGDLDVVEGFGDLAGARWVASCIGGGKCGGGGEGGGGGPLLSGEGVLAHYWYVTGVAMIK
ncbi:uncharacterized protein DS421_20g676880 [Arachis hypogaea]|nr:uncharacterized protein DS421_20g676880 [Arachis hypogaea]